jgi:hypothetical protein
VDGDRRLIPITADPLIDELFPTAAAVLAEQDMCLARSAVFLTVEDCGIDEGDEEGVEDVLRDLDSMGAAQSPKEDDRLRAPFYPLRMEELLDSQGEPRALDRLERETRCGRLARGPKMGHRPAFAIGPSQPLYCQGIHAS